MTNTDSYTTAPPQIPPRREWPISLWIIPDALIGLALTLLASVLLMGINLAIQFVTGDAVFADGVLRLADGTVLFGPGSSPDALQQTLITPGVFFWLLLLQNLAFVSVVLLRVRILRRLPWEWLGVQARNLGKLVLIGIGLGIGFLAMNIIAGLIFDRLLGIQQNQAEQFPIRSGDIIGQIGIFFVAVVLAPIGEELLFRGYFFHAIKQDLGVWAGYIISGMLFAAPHIAGVTQGPVAVLVPLFIGGVMLAVAVQRTGSLVPSIIAHAINNGVAISVLITCTNNPGLCAVS